MSEYQMLFAPVDQSAVVINWKWSFHYINEFAEWDEFRRLLPDGVELPSDLGRDPIVDSFDEFVETEFQRVTAEDIEEARLAFAESMVDEGASYDKAEPYIEGYDNPFSPVELWLDNVSDEYFLGTTTAWSHLKAIAVRHYDNPPPVDELREGWSAGTVTVELDEYRRVPSTWGIYDVRPIFLAGDGGPTSDENGNLTLDDFEKLYP